MKTREFKTQFIPKPNLKVPDILIKPVDVPKELEIGSGNGDFAFQRAKNCPKSYFIAIEKSRTLFYKMLKKQQQNPLKNLWIFNTNAIWWITHFVAPQSLNKIYILYPNIYKKKRQVNLRWFNRPFMVYLLTCLKINGELEIRTNNKNYYLECKLKMKTYKNIINTQDLHIIDSPCTAFEKKYMLQKDICKSLIYKRIL